MHPWRLGYMLPSANFLRRIMRLERVQDVPKNQAKILGTISEFHFLSTSCLSKSHPFGSISFGQFFLPSQACRVSCQKHPPYGPGKFLLEDWAYWVGHSASLAMGLISLRTGLQSGPQSCPATGKAVNAQLVSDDILVLSTSHFHRAGEEMSPNRPWHLDTWDGLISASVNA